MSDPQAAAIFETTRWSLVIAAAGDARFLEPLLRSYWTPIYAFIRRSGYGRDAAADLTQDFVAQIVLERGLVEKVDRDRGRFRTFLRSAVRNFLVDQHRRAHAKGRSPTGFTLTGAALDALDPPETSGEPADAFDRQWAAAILSNVMDRLAADCAACGQEVHWAVFRAAVIDPALGQSSPQPLIDLARTYNIDSPDRVSSMIQTIRRKFQRTLRIAVEETLADPADVDDELGDLKRFLGL